MQWILSWLIYRLRHRKCGVRGCIHELFVWKPERARCERVRPFHTKNEWIQPCTKQLLCRELFITLKTRIFIEIVFITQIKNKNSRTWSRKVAINTSTSLAPIFSISLSSFLESNIFLSNKTSLCGLLYVFFLDAIQTRLGSNQLTQV